MADKIKFREEGKKHIDEVISRRLKIIADRLGADQVDGAIQEFEALISEIRAVSRAIVAVDNG